MNRNNKLTLAGGIGLTWYAIHSFTNGCIDSLATSGASKLICEAARPIYFWVSFLVILFVGILLIYSAFKDG